MSWTHLRDTFPQARKDYRCYLCAGLIRAGERHIVRSGINDGNLNSIRMHKTCEVHTKNWDQMDWECFCEGDLKSYLES